MVLLIIHLSFPLNVEVSYSQTISSAEGKVLHAFLSQDDKWRMRSETPEINAKIRSAFLTKEDKYFYYHPGVNPVAIVRAIFNNISKGRKTSGASTISMQVVRLLEPKNRTYLNKAWEVFRALQLEILLTKEEILLLYLNLVPYGGNVEGIKSASILYFGTLPDNLSLAQIVTLTIIPNRPTSLRLGKNNEKILKERNKWLKEFDGENIFPQEDILAAFQEPLEAKRYPTPRLAPHYSIRLRKLFREDNIFSTMKYNMQEKVQHITFNYLQRVKRQNINNASVIVINNKTGQVEAYLGSPDFADTENAGQVDGVLATRSPGSTLKPFIYALAFDKGEITPKTIMTDVPTDFGGYEPENFDKKFNGRVSVEKALAFSLNIPAVKLVENITLKIFLENLKKAGFKHIARDEPGLGLSVILGGCGVTLEELTNLFVAFANEGTIPNIRYLQSEKQKMGVRLFTPSSAYMITEILTQVTRPDLPNNYQSSYHLPKIAWKTGTSYGRRDAWSIGYNKKYTIGVWLGNFSGKGVPELTGADIATPLLFQIFNSLDYNSQNEWFFRPSDLKFRFVCEESGLLPDEFCTSEIVDYFIPGISSFHKCEHLKNVWISPDEKLSYCTQCLPSMGYKKKLYPNLEIELLDYYHTQNISYAAIPPHNPACERIFADKAPIIISPAEAKEFILDKEDPSEIMLRCQSENQVKKVFWYINNKFYCSAPANEKVFFKPKGGQVKISCTDDKGRNSNAFIQVIFR